MASNSLRSIYKSKVREDTTSISTRRKSRGLERKKCREDEVNKRRLVSDDMSPVVEDSYFDDDDDDEEENPKKPAVHKKASSRLERLQQWREEKKRKVDKEKKESKKPMFKVSPVKYKGESRLYMMAGSNETKLAKKDAATFQAKLAAASNNKQSTTNKSAKEIVKPMNAVGPAKAKTAPSQVSAQMSVPSGVASNARQTRATKSAQPQATKPAKSQSTKERSTRSTRQTAATKPSIVVNPPVVQFTGRPRGKISDLSSKMTASAAAKAKTNLEKPKEFLRAKTRSTKVIVDNSKRDKESSKKQNIKNQEKAATQQVVLTDLPEETNVVVAVPEGSPDTRDLNLSGSSVLSPRHSTPAPRRSARVKRGSERKSKLELEDSSTRSSQKINRNFATPYSSRRHISPVRAFDELNEHYLRFSSSRKVVEFNFFTESAEEDEEQITSDNEDHTEKEVVPSVEGSPKADNAEEMKHIEVSPKADNAEDMNHVESSPKSDNAEEMKHVEGSPKADNAEEMKHVEGSPKADNAEEMKHIEVSPKADNAEEMKHRCFQSTSHSKTGESENETATDLNMSDKENFAHENLTIQEKVLRKSATRLSLNLMRGAKLRKSLRLSVVDRDLVGVATGSHTPSVGKSSDASQSRKRNNGAEVLMGDRLPSSTSKRHRRSVNVSSSLDADLDPNLEQADTDDTQLPIFECAKPSFKEVKMPSAVSKRRSVRIAGLVPSSDANLDDENTPQKAQYPRTPRFRNRKSTRTSLAIHESHVSTFVSVSDEGTSEIIGESVVDEMKLPATPRHAHHPTVSGKSTGRQLRKSLVGSEVIDVSGEGTSLSNDLDPGTVYQVGKPEAKSRVLQELAVKKFDGEVSFIEVPLDENAEGNVSVEQTTPTKDSAVSVCDSQVSADGNTAVSGDDSQSTQPFTPRVSSNVTLSSTENNSPHSSSTSNTPRSSRSRGLTMSGFSSFKTPGEPVSAAITKSQRKRRKTVPNKSPEQMIEILKKSPMVEMTRRRSRHVSSPGIMNPTNLDALLAAEMINVQEATTVSPQVQTIEQVEENGGVRYFRELVLSETSRLNELCNQWNEVINHTVNLSEEVQGQIRAAVGKAQLLMDQRFKQFSGLIDDCEFKLGEKETTLTDLQGFWEMIYFQVENVNHLFVSLTELQQKNWEMKQPSPTKNVPKRKAVKINKPKIKSNFSAFREEVLRRKGQAAVIQSTAALANTVDSGITKTFDAGYFQVKSPIRSSSAGKSNDNSPLMPTVSDAGQSNSTIQDNLTQVGEKPAGSSNEQLSSTPVSQGNKENTVSHIGSRFSSMSAKRLSYLPVVPSPLLNDITDIRPKK